MISGPRTPVYCTKVLPLPLAEVLQLSLLWRWSAGKQHQTCEGPPPSQRRDEINRGVINPLQVF